MRKSFSAWVLRVLLLAALASSAACSQHVDESPSAETPQPAAQQKSAGTSAAGITWTAPSGWKTAPARSMRVATYAVPAVEGDPEDGECAVYFFGTGQGGSLEANLKRWVEQFEQPDGKSSEAVAKRDTRRIAGLAVTTIDFAGTYLASAGPMSPIKEKKPGFRLLGAIVEAPDGLVFIKLTGPAKTVAAAEKDFHSLLESLREE